MLYICTALYIIHNIYRKGKREGKKRKNYLHGLFLFLGARKYVNMVLLKDFSIEGAVVPGLLLCLSKTSDCCNCCNYSCVSVRRDAVLRTGKASL